MASYHAAVVRSRQVMGRPLRRRAGVAAACRRRSTHRVRTSGRTRNSTQNCCAQAASQYLFTLATSFKAPLTQKNGQRPGCKAPLTQTNGPSPGCSLYERPVEVAPHVVAVPHRLPDLPRAASLHELGPLMRSRLASCTQVPALAGAPQAVATCTHPA